MYWFYGAFVYPQTHNQCHTSSSSETSAMILSWWYMTSLTLPRTSKDCKDGATTNSSSGLVVFSKTIRNDHPHSNSHRGSFFPILWLSTQRTPLEARRHITHTTTRPNQRNALYGLLIPLESNFSYKSIQKYSTLDHGNWIARGLHNGEFWSSGERVLGGHGWGGVLRRIFPIKKYW